LKKTPSVVQLPGGVRLNGVPFKITGYDVNGAPKTFEILPSDASHRDCVLFADERWIRSKHR
jgi:hypothetical protein